MPSHPSHMINESRNSQFEWNKKRFTEVKLDRMVICVCAYSSARLFVLFCSTIGFNCDWLNQFCDVRTVTEQWNHSINTHSEKTLQFNQNSINRTLFTVSIADDNCSLSQYPLSIRFGSINSDVASLVSLISCAFRTGRLMIFDRINSIFLSFCRKIVYWHTQNIMTDSIPT